MKFQCRIVALTFILAIAIFALLLKQIKRRDLKWVNEEELPADAESSSAKLSKISLQQKKNNEMSTQIGKRRRKKILIYTALFGSIPWGYIPYNYNFTDYDGKFCPVYDCDVTYDKGQLSRSDLVVFYGRDLPSTEHLKSISKTDRPKNQSWLFYMHESPVFSFFNGTSLKDVFNLTASYRSESDILVTYWFYDLLEDGDPRPQPYQNFAQGKKV